MKTILITGHTGFIGSHLLSILQNYEVIGLSNNLLKNSSIHQIKKDIRNVTKNDIPKNIDCIIHLAGVTHVESCQNDPKTCFQVNFKGIRCQ